MEGTVTSEVVPTETELPNEQVTTEEEAMELEFGLEGVQAKPSEHTKKDDDTKQFKPAKQDVITEHDLASDKPMSGDEEVILVYPFVGGQLIEDAAQGLFLGEDPTTCSPSKMMQLQLEKITPRQFFCTITKEDLKRIQPGVYFNDGLVNFGFNGSQGKNQRRILQLEISARISTQR